MKNPELFQGENYLKKNKVYFEGWYFKNTTSDGSISFIPGISITQQEKKAFIQIITDGSSYFINYNIDDFIFSANPFYIKIKDNYFSPKKIYINIKDEQQGINIYSKLKYLDSINIKTNILNPNIMGPFSYIPSMECNHAIISMKNSVKGLVRINNKKLDFNNGIGYIEKDWGYSFPKTYLWCQANNFKKTNASFMFSEAIIPFKFFKFKGIICVLIIDNKEYKFTTYNGCKLIKFNINKDRVNITIKKGEYYLSIKSVSKTGYKLSAPVNGEMNKDIFETISANIRVTLKKKDNIIFNDESTNCGLEIV